MLSSTRRRGGWRGRAIATPCTRLSLWLQWRDCSLWGWGFVFQMTKVSSCWLRPASLRLVENLNITHKCCPHDKKTFEWVFDQHLYLIICNIAWWRRVFENISSVHTIFLQRNTEDEVREQVSHGLIQLQNQVILFCIVNICTAFGWIFCQMVLNEWTSSKSGYRIKCMNSCSALFSDYNWIAYLFNILHIHWHAWAHVTFNLWKAASVW